MLEAFERFRGALAAAIQRAEVGGRMVRGIEQRSHEHEYATVRCDVAAEVPRSVMLGDAAYGDDCALQDELSEKNLIYALGVRPLTAVGWGARINRVPPRRVRPAVAPRGGATRHIRPSACVLWRRRCRHWRIAPLPGGSTQQKKVSGHFARVRVVTAHDNRARDPKWLVIEWPRGDAEPARFWLPALPEDIAFDALVEAIKGRWRIKRDYLELMQYLGLD